MGTKSRTLSAPNPNVRTRPNGIGRSPKMGRVQQIQPYQLGELVETPLGLRRITGVAPFTINVDLGPRSELVASVSAGGTSLTIKGLSPSVQLDVNDVLIVGDAVGSYRETVKVSSSVSIGANNTTINLTSGFLNNHKKGTLVVVQKLPPGHKGNPIEIEELKILSEDSYAYVIPSVPKLPRYISRTGDTGNDNVKNEALPTGIDPTDNCRRYEAPDPLHVEALLNATAFPAPIEAVPLIYQLYLTGRNSDGTVRPIVDRFGDEIPSASGTPEIENKDPMQLTVEILTKGSAEHQYAETQAFGSYTGNFRVLRIDVPSIFESIIDSTGLTASQITVFAANAFNEALENNLFREPGASSLRTSLLPTDTDGLGTRIHLSHLASDDLETDADRSGIPIRFRCAANVTARPDLIDYAYALSKSLPRYGLPQLVWYIYLETNDPDEAVAEQMHQTLQRTGTASISGGSNIVTGVGTQFTSEFSTSGLNSKFRFEGDSIVRTVTGITNNTTMTVSGVADSTLSGKKLFTTSFSNVPIMKGKFVINDPLEVLGNFVEFRGTSATGKDNAGFISSKVFLELPRGSPRWSSKRALDNGKEDATGFVDAFQSPEDQPNETFGFYVGRNEESLPFMRALNDTGETILDGRVKLSGFIFSAPRVEAQELKKIRQRSGFYKAKVFPHTGFFPKLEDRPTGPPEGWEPRSKTIERSLVQALEDLSLKIRKQMRG